MFNIKFNIERIKAMFRAAPLLLSVAMVRCANNIELDPSVPPINAYKKEKKQ